MAHKSHASTNFCLTSGGCQIHQPRPWLGLVCLSKTALARTERDPARLVLSVNVWPTFGRCFRCSSCARVHLWCNWDFASATATLSPEFSVGHIRQEQNSVVRHCLLFFVEATSQSDELRNLCRVFFPLEFFMVTRSVGLRGAGRARRRLVPRAAASGVIRRHGPSPSEFGAAEN